MLNFEYNITKDGTRYHLYLIENKYIYNLEHLNYLIPNYMFQYVINLIGSQLDNLSDTVILTVTDFYDIKLESIDELSEDHPVNYYADDMINKGLKRFIYDVKSNEKLKPSDFNFNNYEDEQTTYISSVSDLIHYAINLENKSVEHDFMEFLSSLNYFSFPFSIGYSSGKFRYISVFSMNSGSFLNWSIKTDLINEFKKSNNKTFKQYIAYKYYNYYLAEIIYLTEKISKNIPKDSEDEINTIIKLGRSSSNLNIEKLFDLECKVIIALVINLINTIYNQRFAVKNIVKNYTLAYERSM